MTRFSSHKTDRALLNVSSKNLATNREKEFYRILKLVKTHEERSTPVFFPPERNTSNNNLTSKSYLVRVEWRLFGGKYTKNPWKFVRDAWKTLEDIKDGNTKKTKIYRVADKAQKTISTQLNDTMEKEGYCCGEYCIQFMRPVRCCGAKDCYIYQDAATYYRFNHLTYCESCFNTLPDEIIENEEDAINKESFIVFKFIAEREEAFVKCKICGIKQHIICALHVGLTSDSFYCKSCRAIEKIVHVPIRARNLPTTACDRHITNFLASQRVNEDSSVVIRLLSEEEKYLKVKRIFSAYRPDKGYTYKNCTLFCFFETGLDSDICFFSVHFQLYGMDKTCPRPNRNTAYISYVDSVQLLPVPSESRTKIYRLILLGLFDYFKSLGYKKILLWSCPPKQNDDYIFHIKPPHMKMPTQGRLSLWYNELLKLALKLDVIEGFVGFHDHAKTNGWSDLKDIPYVAGDNWVIRMEEAVKAVENEKRRLDTGKISLQKQLFKTVKPSKKAAILAGKLFDLDEKGKVFNAAEMIREKMEVQFAGFNETYFVIYLSTENPEVEQPEPHLNRPWINNRNDFVDYFWANMFEFSSERRAQYSTTMMLHRIFVESKICIGCQRSGNISESLLCEDCSTNLHINHPGRYEFYNLAWGAGVDALPPVVQMVDAGSITPESGYGSPQDSRNSQYIGDSQDIDIIPFP